MTGSLALTLLAALGAALVLGAIAHRLRMPPMVGYIAAGLLVGPFTPGPVADVEEVEGLAEIGVALLMFSIGLRFRLVELLEAGRVVIAGAPLQVAFSMGLGTAVAVGLGLNLVESVFIGAVVSVCSSVVLVKVAGETALETTLHGRLALSWSIAQDLITVVLVVILTAIATDSDQPLRDGLIATGAAALYVVGVLVIGSRPAAGRRARDARAVRGGHRRRRDRDRRPCRRGGGLGRARRVRGRLGDLGVGHHRQRARRDRPPAGAVLHDLLRLGGHPAQPRGGL
jgi:predicted Kef-type K+ transport protein